MYEQQRDTFIGQAMTEIWAFQQIVFGLGDSSDSSTIVENGVRELEEGLELKQTRIDSENIDNRQVERSRG